MKARKMLYITLLFIAVTVAILWSSGLFSLWFGGMAILANNTVEFTDKNGHQLDGRYSLEVDLSDLESNIGKEIYNDGEHRIYVSWLKVTHNGGFDIGFRSSGQYSLSGATLISALHHETINIHSFTTSSTTILTAEYNGKTYNAQLTGQCGLNYKDGDCFSFTFFLRELPNEDNIKDVGIVNLTIVDLYKNIWIKK
ncbi:hypothetical protein QFZ77_006942 [Paenibacillus sp. V4I3]|uniref:hypothetical protein n=1 Tax=Paenibacillus sp. V4I3 TaxID=3042305 RepID=UPI002785EEE4|nr:hypothetical protein [Paenibacillus sp. V4I3]MDQ0878283.1 hypothetical protein [Paenibacillus sp. V4I3]